MFKIISKYMLKYNSVWLYCYVFFFVKLIRFATCSGVGFKGYYIN